MNLCWHTFASWCFSLSILSIIDPTETWLETQFLKNANANNHFLQRVVFQGRLLQSLSEKNKSANFWKLQMSAPGDNYCWLLIITVLSNPNNRYAKFMQQDHKKCSTKIKKKCSLSFFMNVNHFKVNRPCSWHTSLWWKALIKIQLLLANQNLSTL